MIDIGWSEMLAIAVVLIVVVGPKDLPAVLRGIGQMVRKLRGMADEFRRGVDDFIRESELKDLKDGVQQVKDFNLNRLKTETERQFNQTVNPTSSSSPSGTGTNSAANTGAGGASNAPAASPSPSSSDTAASAAKPAAPANKAPAAAPENKDA